MLDLMGCGYVVDCCISAFNHIQERRNFEIYITDVAAALINMWAKDPYPRYYDLIHPQEQDKRSGEEIAADIIAKHGLKVVG